MLAEETVCPHKADWYCYMSSTSWSLEVSIRRCRIDGSLHLESLDELIGTVPLLERKGALGHRSSAPIPAVEGYWKILSVVLYWQSGLNNMLLTELTNRMDFATSSHIYSPSKRPIKSAIWRLILPCIGCTTTLHRLPPVASD